MTFVIHHGALKLETINQGKATNTLHEIPPNLIFEIERAGDRLVSKAVQLISNNTTNLTECYMSIRAKMDGGNKLTVLSSQDHLNIAAWQLVYHLH